jgi:hypothetical protein
MDASSLKTERIQTALQTHGARLQNGVSAAPPKEPENQSPSGTADPRLGKKSPQETKIGAPLESTAQRPTTGDNKSVKPGGAQPATDGGKTQAGGNGSGVGILVNAAESR